VSFTARRVSLSLCGESMPLQLVYRREDIEPLRDVGAIVERARRAAFAIVLNARETARAIEARAATARRERERDAQIALVAQARALEEAYRRAQDALNVQLEATLDRALASALAHIGAILPAQQRLRIVCAQLAREAGPAPGASLFLARADEAIYRGAGPLTPWATQIDDALASGQCRLASEHGQWVLDFDTLMAALARAAGAGSGAPNTD
jgi:hypothetical protein